MCKLLLSAIFGVILVGCGGPKGPLPEKPSTNIGRCVYTNGFSKKPECREYRGSKWTSVTVLFIC